VAPLQAAAYIVSCYVKFNFLELSGHFVVEFCTKLFVFVP